jgi:hypothetical protein
LGLGWAILMTRVVCSAFIELSEDHFAGGGLQD